MSELTHLAPLLAEVMADLATELDLHYEDHEMFALKPSIDLLKKSVGQLEASKTPVPDSVIHIIARYHRSSN